jgi:hypothetical protein
MTKPIVGKTALTELLFWKAFFGLLAFDLFGLGRNFQRLHHTVTRWPVSNKIARPDDIDRVCEAVNYACAWYPKRALCLQRSAVTTCLLRTYGLGGQLILGAQRLPFKAHAWVEVEGRVVNERSDVQKIYGVWDRC